MVSNLDGVRIGCSKDDDISFLGSLRHEVKLVDIGPRGCCFTANRDFAKQENETIPCGTVKRSFSSGFLTSNKFIML